MYTITTAPKSALAIHNFSWVPSSTLSNFYLLFDELNGSQYFETEQGLGGVVTILVPNKEAKGRISTLV